MDKVVKKSFSRSDGPFVSGLDKALASFHVERQAYYSGTFVGNHVHRCLKVWDLKVPKIHKHLLKIAQQENNIHTLCSSVPATALEQYPSLHGQAQQIAEKFKKVFVLFSKCHKVYESNYVDSDEVKELCECDTS